MIATKLQSRSGQTLAQIAEERGMTADQLKADLLENMTADLQASVNAGRITQEQYDTITGSLDQKVDNLVNGLHVDGPALHPSMNGAALGNGA